MRWTNASELKAAAQQEASEAQEMRQQAADRAAVLDKLQSKLGRMTAPKLANHHSWFAFVA